MPLKLDATKIVETAEKLAHRVDERFPGSGLSRVSVNLLDLTRQSAARAQSLGRPYLFLRFCVVLLTVVILGLVLVTLLSLDLKTEDLSVSDFTQMIEAGINDLIFLAIAIYFLFSYEGRLKRDRALEAIHDLRALAHIVDMHQLTKDPERLFIHGSDTASSPKRSMDRFALSRYLDYCTELLAILSKIAALYVQRLRDPAVLDAVDGIEDLTNGLSRKIWQKIMILDMLPDPEPCPEPCPEPRPEPGAEPTVHDVHSQPSTPSIAQAPAEVESAEAAPPSY